MSQPMKQIRADLLDVFAKPYVMVERVREYISDRDGVYRITDTQIGNELGLNQSNIANFKTRNSPTFALYVLKWCILNGYDVEKFIKK